MAWYDSFPVPTSSVTLLEAGKPSLDWKAPKTGRVLINVTCGTAKIRVETGTGVKLGEYTSGSHLLDTSINKDTIVRARLIAPGIGYKVTLVQF